MYNLAKKQKIIIAILAIIVALAVFYYVYLKDNNNFFEEQNEELEIEESKQEDSKEKEEEQYSDDIIVVHITGAVNKEGIVELKVNSRVVDAIDKAEGLRQDADTKKINLASILEDGTKLYIPSVNDTEETIKENNVENTESIINNYNESTLDKPNNSKEQKVNINIATQTELEQLPGIGPSTALKIIQHRNENGRFKSIDEIKDVSGIGSSKYDKIKELITIK